MASAHGIAPPWALIGLRGTYLQASRPGRPRILSAVRHPVREVTTIGPRDSSRLSKLHSRAASPRPAAASLPPSSLRMCHYPFSPSFLRVNQPELSSVAYRGAPGWCGSKCREGQFVSPSRGTLTTRWTIVKLNAGNH